MWHFCLVGTDYFYLIFILMTSLKTYSILKLFWMTRATHSYIIWMDLSIKNKRALSFPMIKKNFADAEISCIYTQNMVNVQIAFFKDFFF